MTIISATRATLAQPAFALAIGKSQVKPGDSIRTVLLSKPESTTLVRDFVLSFKELEDYK